MTKEEKNPQQKKQLVILGAGFAGLKLAKLMKNTSYEVTIIDKHNYHEFAPLFYQIASCGLEPGAICFPLRKEFWKADNIHYRYGDVLSIDPDFHKIVTDTEEIFYDELVIATGVTTKFFGMQQVKDFSFTLKTTSEGLLLRNQILLCLEKAGECNDLNSRKKMLTFVVSGAGPAGVEVSGALGELKKYVIPREYPEINPDEVRILLIEATDKVLRTMSDTASRKSAKFLQELEVELMLNTGISDYDGNVVTTTKGDQILTDTLIWTAGVEGFQFPGLRSDVYGPSNRLKVNEYNQLIDHPHIYAIGDCCIMLTAETPYGHPQVAQVAIQQATNLAKNLKEKSLTHAFSYYDKGSMATIGRNRAVVDLKIHKFAGRFAWWMWLLVHLLTLVGIRNKIVTFINWVVNYFTYNSSLRLLIKPTLRGKRPSPYCAPCEGNKELPNDSM